MKNFLKTFVLTAALIPCVLFAACGKDNAKPNPDEYSQIDAETAYNDYVRSGLAFFNNEQNKQFTINQTISTGEGAYLAKLSVDLENETFVVIGKQNDEITNRNFSVHSNNYVRVYEYTKIEVEPGPGVVVGGVKDKTYKEYSKLSTSGESEWATYWQNFLVNDSISTSDGVGLKYFTSSIPTVTVETTYQEFLNGFPEDATVTGKKYQDGRFGLSISFEATLPLNNTSTVNNEFIVKDGKLLSVVANQGSGLLSTQTKSDISYSYTDADIPTDLDAYEFNNFESFDEVFSANNSENRTLAIKYLQNVYSYAIQSEFIELKSSIIGPSSDVLYLTKEKTYSKQQNKETWQFIDGGQVKQVVKDGDGAPTSDSDPSYNGDNMIDYYLSHGIIPLSVLESTPEKLTNWQVEDNVITLTISVNDATVELTIENSLITLYRVSQVSANNFTLTFNYNPTPTPTIPPVPQTN